MLKFSLYILTLVCLTFILSCAKSPTPKETNCLLTCETRFKHCCRICKDNCKTCSNLSKTQSFIRYQQYLHEQSVQGGEITRTLQSYRDQLQCRKITCDCAADLHVCKQACTGVIRKRLQRVPPCCEWLEGNI